MIMNFGTLLLLAYNSKLKFEVYFFRDAYNTKPVPVVDYQCFLDREVLDVKIENDILKIFIENSQA